MTARRCDQPAEPGSALRWARSGGMYLSGPGDGPPILPPVDLLATLDDALAAFHGAFVDYDRPAPDRFDTTAEMLLFGRAGLLGYRRNGRTSLGGTCRILPSRDRWVAINLARTVDHESVPAVTGGRPGDDPWASLGCALTEEGAAPVVARARELGIPCGVLPGDGELVRDGEVIDPVPAVTVTQVGGARMDGPQMGGARRTPRPSPLVVDLSSMWAGPLAGALLRSKGARVIRVESPTRPDGTRHGDPRFAGWLHHGSESVALDLRTPEAVATLEVLLTGADIVIESSRPRAFEQMGIDAAEILTASGGTWVRITGHGRGSGQTLWSAFGDDVAVAGGLVGTDDDGRPVFCGDAIADPITGVLTALSAATALRDGGGALVDVTMVGVVADLVSNSAPIEPCEVTAGGDDRWVVSTAEGEAVVEPPPVLAPAGMITPLGADTASVLAEFDLR